jgi:hypothetical protein
VSVLQCRKAEVITRSAPAFFVTIELLRVEIGE